MDRELRARFVFNIRRPRVILRRESNPHQPLYNKMNYQGWYTARAIWIHEDFYFNI